MDGLDDSNISSNGRDTLKATTTWEPADQIHALELIKLYHRHSPLENIKGRRTWSQVQCPPGLIYLPLLGVVKKAGPRLLQLSSIPPRLAPASQLLSSTPNRQTTNHHPENRPPYSSSFLAQSSPNPMSRYGLNTPKICTNSSFASKTNYPSKPTTNMLLNTGTSAATITAHTTTIPTAAKACLPRLPTRLCPSSRPRKGPLESTCQPSPLLLTNSGPLWLKRHPSPFRHVLPKHALINSTDLPLTCLDLLYEDSWPPFERGISRGSLSTTDKNPASPNSKTPLRNNLKYRTTCTLAPTGSKPTTNDAPPMPKFLIKMATLYHQNGCATSKMGAWPPMPWEPPSTRCHTLWTYTPNPLSTMRTNPSNPCLNGSTPPCIPTKHIGKYCTRKYTKWRSGVLPLKLSSIGTSIGSSMVWPRRSSSCKWIWRALDRLLTYVSIGSKWPEPTNSPNTVNVTRGLRVSCR